MKRLVGNGGEDGTDVGGGILDMLSCETEDVCCFPIFQRFDVLADDFFTHQDWVMGLTVAALFKGNQVVHHAHRSVVHLVKMG